MAAVLGKPRSVGRIRYRSARVTESPELETVLLEDEADRATIKGALRHIGRLAKTDVIAKLARPVYPSRRPFDDAGEIRHKLFSIAGSGYHPCGTVPMGPDSDPNAATDGRGRVRGVEGLHVADASLMPTIPSSNTNLPTLMIGERFGEWLRDATP
jgi:choline dehydrogenase